MYFFPQKLKIKIGLSSLAFIIFLALSIVLYASDKKAGSKSYLIRKVVIDAGHGGKDPGAVGKKSYEKNIALAIALKLGKFINVNYPEIEVIYTRKTDEFIELHRRAQIANEAKADLFISIHCNSNRSSKHYGTATYVMGLHRTDDNLEVVKNENSSIYFENNYLLNYQGYDPALPESEMIFSLFQETYLDYSLIFADKIQKQFSKLGRYNYGVKQAGLLVLYRTAMPAVLVETAFISNLVEEKYLISSQGQDFLASAIYRAFKEYKIQMESSHISSNTTEKNQVEKKEVNQVKEENTGSVVYSIQITSSLKPIKLQAANFKGLSDVKELFQDGKYKYLTAENKSIDDVKKYLPEVRKKFPDAFVVASKNGKRISLADAQKEK